MEVKVGDFVVIKTDKDNEIVGEVIKVTSAGSGSVEVNTYRKRTESPVIITLPENVVRFAEFGERLGLIQRKSSYLLEGSRVGDILVEESTGNLVLFGGYQYIYQYISSGSKAICYSLISLTPEDGRWEIVPGYEGEGPYLIPTKEQVEKFWKELGKSRFSWDTDRLSIGLKERPEVGSFICSYLGYSRVIEYVEKPGRDVLKVCMINIENGRWEDDWTKGTKTIDAIYASPFSLVKENIYRKSKKVVDPAPEGSLGSFFKKIFGYGK